MSSNCEPIILQTLGNSVITCVSVYLGMPRKALSEYPKTGARNGLLLTVITNTLLVDCTVNATQETATLLPANYITLRIYS